jgi:hypothetical protein
MPYVFLIGLAAFGVMVFAVIFIGGHRALNRLKSPPPPPREQTEVAARDLLIAHLTNSGIPEKDAIQIAEHHLSPTRTGDVNPLVYSEQTRREVEAVRSTFQDPTRYPRS